MPAICYDGMCGSIFGDDDLVCCVKEGSLVRCVASYQNATSIDVKELFTGAAQFNIAEIEAFELLEP
jgi:hypothetical protein